MSTEAQTINVRYNWLKLMYLYTVIMAGGIGILYVLSPGTFTTLTGIPIDEPIMPGVASSVYVAFGVLSLLGFRAPLKFVPVLLLQLAYKVIWYVAVIIPLVIAGKLPSYAVPMIFIFATFVIGDLIAIPFRYLFAGAPIEPPSAPAATG